MAPRTPGVQDLLGGDEVADVLRGAFFVPSSRGEAGPDPRAAARPGPVVARPRPDHYKVICISLYNRDLDRLDAAVRELKRRGLTKANRSAVLRVALEQLDLDRVPRGL